MLPTIAEADRAAESARRAADLLKHVAPTGFADPRDRNELIVACEFTELFARKVRLARAAGFGPRDLPASEHRPERLSRASDAFAQCWLARNKLSGLRDILDALAVVADDLYPPDQPMADAPNP
jgi:hypothetical protein